MSALLEVRDLTKLFEVGGGLLQEPSAVRAVDGVSFDIASGETLGLVGESGCGKSTLARLILRLIDPTSGSVRFQDKDIAHLSERQLRSVRANIQVVLQNPYAALDPRMRIGESVAQPLRVHDRGSRRVIESRVSELLELVGLSEAHRRRYPHELSGGQCQRVAIARALSLEPELVILDEPTSALDVSVQAQILRLLEKLRDEKSLTYLFISHDLSVVRYMSDRIGVMYLGQIVEEGPAARVFDEPAHHYTRALLESAPTPSFGERSPITLLPGQVPSAVVPPPGCRFHPRCVAATDVCAVDMPEPTIPGDRRLVRCHHPLTQISTHRSKT